MRGLVRHHGEDPAKFIRETHQFPELASMVVGENALGHALQRLAGTRLVFSNAPRHYVEEVLRALGVARVGPKIHRLVGGKVVEHLLIDNIA